MTDDDDAESRRRRIAENVAKALGKHADVKIQGGKVLAFKRPGPAYDAASIKAIEGLTAEPRIIRNRIRCLKCHDIIESQTVHDFKPCSCGAAFVDGGHGYQRIGGEPEDYENLSEYRDV